MKNREKLASNFSWGILLGMCLGLAMENVLRLLLGQDRYIGMLQKNWSAFRDTVLFVVNVAAMVAAWMSRQR